VIRAAAKAEPLGVGVLVAATVARPCTAASVMAAAVAVPATVLAVEHVTVPVAVGCRATPGHVAVSLGLVKPS
jgi:hypothetical protein